MDDEVRVVRGRGGERRRGGGAGPDDGAAHERRFHIVVAPAADGLGQVFLEVLEAVAVEVEIADRAGARVLGVDRGAGVERVGGIHAAGDIRAVGGDGEAREAVGDLELVGVDEALVRVVERAVGVEAGAGKLAFPAVGQAVGVGIGRARVHAAAAEAEAGVVVGDRTVDEHRAAFSAVEDAVSVRIAVARIGREELVPPAGVRAGEVRVDGVDAGVGVGGVAAGVFGREVEAVGVVVVVFNRVVAAFKRVLGAVGDDGVEVGVEFPAVRHAVGVGVGAVDRLRVGGCGVAVGLARERNVRVGGAVEEPQEDGVVLRSLAEVGAARVLVEEVFIAGGERLGVRVEAALVDRVVDPPARRDMAARTVVHDGHGGARVEAEEPIDLLVDETDGVVVGDLGVFGQDHLDGLESVVVAVEAVGGGGDLVAVEGAEARVERGMGRQKRAHEGLRAGAEDAVARRVDVVVGGEVVVRGGLVDGDDDDAGAGDYVIAGELDEVLRVGHVVVVRVDLAVRIGERVETESEFPTVGHAVAVRIAIEGAGADEVFLVVGEAVVIGIARDAAAVDERIVCFGDRVGRDFLRAFEVVEVEALAGDAALPLAALFVRIADVRAVPDPVFIAVGEAVAVGVGLDGVGGTLRRPAAGAGVERGEVFRREREDVRRGNDGAFVVGLGDAGVEDVRDRRDGHILELVGRLEALPLHVGGHFIRRVVGVGVGAVGVQIAGVETGTEAADFVVGVECAALVGPAVGDAGVEAVAGDFIERQVVVVGIGVGEVGDVGRAVERDAEVVVEEAAVGDAVLVDVAAVVERTPFLGEDGVDDGLAVDAVLAGGSRQVDVRRPEGAAFRPDGGAEERDRARGAIVAGGLGDVCVEVGVAILVGVGVAGREVRGVLGAVAVGVDGPVAADGACGVELAVVDVAHLVAPRVERSFMGAAGVPVEREVLGAVVVGRGPDVALADALLRRIARGERERTARRSDRGRDERLLRRDGEVPFVEHRTAVRVGNREKEIDVARRVELRSEGFARERGHGLGTIGGVVAAGPLDREALGDIGVDVVQDVPRDGADGGPAVRGFVRERGDAGLGLDVRHGDARGACGVVFVCRLAARRESRRAEDLGRDGEARVAGAVERIGVDREADRARVGDGEVVVVDRRAGGVFLGRLDHGGAGFDAQAALAARLRRAGVGDGDAHGERLAQERVVVAERDVDRAGRIGVLFERARRGDGDRGRADRDRAHGVGRLRPVVHVLVLVLEDDAVCAGLDELDRVLGVGGGVRVAAQFLRVDALVAEPRGPLDVERVIAVRHEVVGLGAACVGDDGLEDMLRFAARILVRERVAVVFRFEAIHLDAGDDRLDVRDADVQVVGGVVAGHELRLVVLLRVAEDDFELELEALAAGAFEEFEGFIDRILVLADRDADRLRDVGIVADDEVGIEHRGLGVGAGLQEGVDGLAFGVGFGELDVELHLVAFAEGQLSVGGGDGDRGGGVDESIERLDFALVAADGRDDVELGDVGGVGSGGIPDFRELGRESACFGVELVEDAARADAVDAVDLGPGLVLGRALVEDGVAGGAVGLVGIRIGDDDRHRGGVFFAVRRVERSGFARTGPGIDARRGGGVVLAGGGRVDGLDVHESAFIVFGVEDGLGVGHGAGGDARDGDGKLDGVVCADRMLVAAKGVDVDRIRRDEAAGRDRDRDSVGGSGQGVGLGGETHVGGPGFRRGRIRELGGVERHGEVGGICLVDGDGERRGLVGRGARRVERLRGGSDGERRRLGIDAADGDGEDVVRHLFAARIILEAVGPRGHVEVGGAALGDAADFEEACVGRVGVRFDHDGGDGDGGLHAGVVELDIDRARSRGRGAVDLDCGLVVGPHVEHAVRADGGRRERYELHRGAAALELHARGLLVHFAPAAGVGIGGGGVPGLVEVDALHEEAGARRRIEELHGLERRVDLVVREPLVHDHHAGVVRNEGEVGHVAVGVLELPAVGPVEHQLGALA